MTKQKMVLKVSMEDRKRRSRALQIATGFIGVLSASVEDDRIVVVGEGVDSITLTTALRKRMSYAELISVETVDDKKEKKNEPEVKVVEPISLPYYYHNLAMVPTYPYVTQDYLYDPYYRIF